MPPNGTTAGSRGQAGGDNPVYVERMHALFQRNADILAYEAYFSDSSKEGDVYSSLTGAQTMLRHQ